MAALGASVSPRKDGAVSTEFFFRAAPVSKQPSTSLLPPHELSQGEPPTHTLVANRIDPLMR